MREIFEVDLFGPDLFEVSALLVSHLIWPAPAEAKQRAGLYLSFYAWFVRDRAKKYPDWAQQRQWIQPNAVCRSEADMRRDFRTLDRRIRDRLTAGHVAVAFLQEAESGETPLLPDGAKRLSINQMIETMDLGISDIDNMAKRVWRPSLPVIHLCAAWATVQQEHFRAHGRAAAFVEALQDADVIAQIVHRAQLYEPLLERGRLKIEPDSLVRFRFAPTGVKTNPVS